MIDAKELRRLALDGDLAAMQEIILRLEAAESARRDDYKNWMTALDRNAELLAKLEAAKEDRSNFLVEMGKLCAKCDALCLRIEATEKERDELRAKIEAMERQEPAAIQHRVPSVDFRGECVGYSEWRDGKGLEHWPHRTLYALPGAKGE